MVLVLEMLTLSCLWDFNHLILNFSSLQQNSLKEIFICTVFGQGSLKETARSWEVFVWKRLIRKYLSARFPQRVLWLSPPRSYRDGISHHGHPECPKWEMGNETPTFTLSFSLFEMLSSQIFCQVVYSCMLSGFSHVQLLSTLWNVARQAPLSMEFCRQQCWSELPCPPPGDLPSPEVELAWCLTIRSLLVYLFLIDSQT